MKLTPEKKFRKLVRRRAASPTVISRLCASPVGATSAPLDLHFHLRFESCFHVKHLPAKTFVHVVYIGAKIAALPCG